MSAETRRRPNILITGTPGTGKSTLAQEVASRLQFDMIDKRVYDSIHLCRFSQRSTLRLGTQIKENIECEIFGSLLEEARDSYKQEIIHELRCACVKPVVIVVTDNGKKLLFKTDNMPAMDLIMRFNKLLGNPELGKSGTRPRPKL
ncbi:hypothetical protein TELCIR_14434 [Teladorsagia circumcincta]|uniref:Uncharacterized protein n=1 Tax=Teladorsagia circumcincta TaxID=45464 RepID=A0A2G9U122_TELCI|nr:hypothetical protein TELCIR_14434 [Teladorsagia circumcincta]